MSGNLIKRAPLLRKPRFTNANNAHPVHRNPQGTTVVEQVMTTRVSDIQLRDLNPQGREEWLTRAINYLKSYPDVNVLYKKLPTEDRILLDMVRGTATLGGLTKGEEVLRKQYASSQMSVVQVALSGMHLAGNELPSEMLRKTLQKAHLSVSIMNKGLDMLFSVVSASLTPRSAFEYFWLFGDNTTTDE